MFRILVSVFTLRGEVNLLDLTNHAHWSIRRIQNRNAMIQLVRRATLEAWVSSDTYPLSSNNKRLFLLFFNDHLIHFLLFSKDKLDLGQIFSFADLILNLFFSLFIPEHFLLFFGELYGPLEFDGRLFFIIHCEIWICIEHVHKVKNWAWDLFALPLLNTMYKSGSCAVLEAVHTCWRLLLKVGAFWGKHVWRVLWRRRFAYQVFVGPWLFDLCSFNIELDFFRRC